MLCYSSVKQAMEHTAKQNIGKQTKSIHRAASSSASESPQIIQCQQCNNDDSAITLHPWSLSVQNSYF